MLLDREVLDGIAHGRITLQFRRWKRPTVRAGGTLLTAIGRLGIDAVERVADVEEISEVEARAAGFEDRAALEAALNQRSEGSVYRIALRLVGPDPRVALRTEIPGGAELEEIVEILDRWDRSSPVGAWTYRTLLAIEREPGVRALDLAEKTGMERAHFKANVRRLKGLGLTESLPVGYRLSPRGRAVVGHVEESEA